MTETLRDEELKIVLNTLIYSQVVARYNIEYDFINPDTKLPAYRWRFEMMVSGPDNRYAPGFASLKPERLKDFISALEKSTADAISLKDKKLSANYTRCYTPQLSNPSVELQIIKGNVRICIGIRSHTGHQFDRHLNIRSCQETIKIISECFTLGPNLISELKNLHEPTPPTEQITDPPPENSTGHSIAPPSESSRKWWEFWK